MACGQLSQIYISREKWGKKNKKRKVSAKTFMNLIFFRFNFAQNIKNSVKAALEFESKFEMT